MPFTDRDLLAALPPATLVQHVPLPHIFDAILHTRVAKVHGYLPEEPKAALVALPASTEQAAPAVEAQPGEAAPSAQTDAPAAAPTTTDTAAAQPTKTNGNGTPNARRRSTKPPPGEAAVPREEGDTEWIEIPESTR